MHESAYNDGKRFVEKYLDGDKPIRIADIGSRDVNGTLRPLFDRAGWSYVGMDVAEGPNVDIVLSSQYSWPEVKSEFDVVVSTSAMEHISRPWKWIPELARILVPGGILYVCAPNTWEYHEYPIDCWRVWPDGMRALFEDSGIEVIEAYYSGTDTSGIGRKPGVIAHAYCN